MEQVHVRMYTVEVQLLPTHLFCLVLFECHGAMSVAGMDPITGPWLGPEPRPPLDITANAFHHGLALSDSAPLIAQSLHIQSPAAAIVHP